jgi:FMN phosphatase YigB (HAD superfamily)
MENEKRVVICDVGGVVWPLIDMQSWLEKLYLENNIWPTRNEFETAKNVAYKVALEPFERGKKTAGEFQILFQSILGLEHLDAVTFWKHYINIVGEINVPLLECLRSMQEHGVILALLSNIDEERLKYAMVNRRDEYKKIANLFHLFHYHFFSCRIGSRKPEPTIYRHALEMLSVLPSHIYFLDDYQPNIDGMAAAIPAMPRGNMHLYHINRHEEAVAFFQKHQLI